MTGAKGVRSYLGFVELEERTKFIPEQKDGSVKVARMNARSLR